MKANELTDGIYVYFNCFDGSKIIVKVTGFKDNIVYGVSEHGTHWCPISKTEPIPLTAEILEKNGFHKKWDEDIIVMVCDTIIVEIGDKYKLYKDGKMYLRRVLSPLYYVHQLQHALRLCGIEKEIIL